MTDTKQPSPTSEASTSTPSSKSTAEPLAFGRQSAFDTSFLLLFAIACCAAAAVAWLKGPGRVVEIAATYLGFLLVLTPKILCGFFVAASVPILVPPEQMTRWLGRESGARGLLVASAAGALVPGGPMMIFPLAAGFLAAGAGIPTVITFVTAWSLYGLNRTIIWEMSFLHLDFVLLRVAICLPFPFLAGWFASKVLK